jgi:hypothetical protein
MAMQPGSKGYDGSRRKPRVDFALVESIGRGLPGVEVSKVWGTSALKVHGRMFVCIASHKSAEPNTLAVRMAIAERDLLIEEDPEVYYLKEHYVNYPCVLVRMSKVNPDALQDLVVGAHRFVAAGGARKPARRGGRRQTGARRGIR